MRKGYYTGYREMGRSIPGFIACCFFAAPSLFVLSPFFSVLFPSFFCFCYFLAAKRCFSGKIASFSRTLFPPSLFFLLKTPSLFFFGTEGDFFFSLFFHPFYFFSPSCLYNLVLYRLPISIFLHESGKTVDVSAR